MKSSQSLLDTDTLSAIMRQQSRAVARAKTYQMEHGMFILSAMTCYEIRRGLRLRKSMPQLTLFEEFCAVSHILPVSEAITQRAARIYALLYERGQLISDYDIIVAATALEHGLILVTNNSNHLSRVPDLRVENWLL